MTRVLTNTRPLRIVILGYLLFGCASLPKAWLYDPYSWGAPLFFLGWLALNLKVLANKGSHTDFTLTFVPATALGFLGMGFDIQVLNHIALALILIPLRAGAIQRSTLMVGSLSWMPILSIVYPIMNEGMTLGLRALILGSSGVAILLPKLNKPCSAKY